MFLILMIAISSGVLAQEAVDTQQDQKRKIIQFTGVIFANDSLSVIPGVHVYAPKGGRGTTTNPYGFFSLPVLEGDSIVFSAIGFERSYYIIPKHDEETSLKKLVYLEEDVTYLKEVEVFPFPSEATFKAAILAAELPDQYRYDNVSRWANSEVLRRMYYELPSSADMNYRNQMQQQMNAQVYRVQPPSNSLLNPFAWASFIRSLKSGN